MAYTPPTWTNNAPPALNAANLNAMAQAVKAVSEDVEELQTQPTVTISDDYVLTIGD